MGSFKKIRVDYYNLRIDRNIASKELKIKKQLNGMNVR